jgi:hypothetical protein
VFRDAESLDPIEENNESNMHSIIRNIDDLDDIYQKCQAFGIYIDNIDKESENG